MLTIRCRNLSIAAAIFLTSCSGEPDPFTEMTSSEVMSYILFGLEDKVSETSEKEETKIEIQKESQDPLKLKWTARSTSDVTRSIQMDLTVTTENNCDFIFHVTGMPGDGTENNSKIRVDFRGLKHVFIDDKSVNLSGVQASCLPPTDDRICNDMNATPSHVRHRRLRFLETDDAIAIEQKRLDAAVTHFHEKICPISLLASPE